ncbi:hypothetical protein M758_UG043900 [Ceratodon purpureus]|nr:hypothetical protein M758_UG043600 [Ceratodon purpureus]KAG0594055.1 hypothetical protein M758_UG043900 [Ceratodon purpureus]
MSELNLPKVYMPKDPKYQLVRTPKQLCDNPIVSQMEETLHRKKINSAQGAAAKDAKLIVHDINNCKIEIPADTTKITRQQIHQDANCNLHYKKSSTAITSMQKPGL